MRAPGGFRRFEQKPKSQTCVLAALASQYIDERFLHEPGFSPDSMVAEFGQMLVDADQSRRRFVLNLAMFVQSTIFGRTRPLSQTCGPNRANPPREAASTGQWSPLRQDPQPLKLEARTNGIVQRGAARPEAGEGGLHADAHAWRSVGSARRRGVGWMARVGLCTCSTRRPRGHVLPPAAGEHTSTNAEQGLTHSPELHATPNNSRR